MDAKNTIILITSNAGAESVVDSVKGIFPGVLPGSGDPKVVSVKSKAEYIRLCTTDGPVIVDFKAAWCVVAGGVVS